MKILKDFFSKFGIQTLTFLIIVLSLQTCSKNRKLTKLNKEITQLKNQKDSLIKLIPSDSILVYNKSKIEYSVYSKLNDELVKYDRAEQMKDFQLKFILTPKKELEDKINNFENK